MAYDIEIVTNDDPSVVTRGAAAASRGIKVGGTKVLGTQEAHIADASVAHALNSTFSDTEAEAALNALGVKVNAVLAAMRAHGLLASS